MLGTERLLGNSLNSKKLARDLGQNIVKVTGPQQCALSWAWMRYRTEKFSWVSEVHGILSDALESRFSSEVGGCAWLERGKLHRVSLQVTYCVSACNAVANVASSPASDIRGSEQRRWLVVRFTPDESATLGELFGWRLLDSAILVHRWLKFMTQINLEIRITYSRKNEVADIIMTKKHCKDLRAMLVSLLSIKSSIGEHPCNSYTSSPCWPSLNSCSSPYR